MFYGDKGVFNHSGLSAANLGDGFSSLSSSMSTLRSGLLTPLSKATNIVPLNHRQSFTMSMDDCWKVCDGVRRYKFDSQEWENDRCNKKAVWYPVPILVKGNARGFAMDNVVFRKGSERRAFRFQDIDQNGKAFGKMLVAKKPKDSEIRFS